MPDDKADSFMKKHYKISLDEQNRLLEELSKRTDAEASRIKRYLVMPDLSRTEGSPLKEIVDRTLKVESLKDFDVIEIPEIISTEILFDKFNFASDHPARSKSDTYYVDDKHVLRPHDTAFWHYYLELPEIQKQIASGESFGAICFGKVYRKDEIDNRHMNVFHQMGGLLLAPDAMSVTPEGLKMVLSQVARGIFGDAVEFRFYDHNFPYTDPSFEMEAMINGKWIEMLGSGMPKKAVLSNFGLEGYHGWAFGFGLERLAIASMELPDIRLLWSDDERVKKQLVLGNKYKEVSKFPAVVRDISFVVDVKDFVLNDYFDAIRDILGDAAEQVELLDKYENATKFGEGKISYTFRITYRDLHKTLTNEEVNTMHTGVEEMTQKDFGGVIRVS